MTPSFPSGQSDGADGISEGGGVAGGGLPAPICLPAASLDVHSGTVMDGRPSDQNPGAKDR